MAMNMQCPECGHEFEIEESQQAQDNQAEALKAQKTQLKAEYKKEKDTEIEKQVTEELKEKVAEALEAQKKESAIEITQLEAEYKKEKDTEIEKKLKNAHREYKLDKEKEFKEIEKESTAKITQKELKISRLTDQIKELEKAATGSQESESKGHAAEVILKNNLKERFPGDRIEHIGKGKSGADFKHYVYVSSTDGPPVVKGMILIECKSTKSFQKIWIKKLKKDMEKSEANIGVIVTDNMPKKQQKQDVGIYKPASNIYVLKAISAVDQLFSIRDRVITDSQILSDKKLSEDEQALKRISIFVTDEAKPLLEEIGHNIREKRLNTESMKKEFKRIIKKEEKNLDDQINVLEKLVNGFRNASQNKLNLVDLKKLTSD